jgi:tripartite-type tricarboxylate transporter receptor subunit TctC
MPAKACAKLMPLLVAVLCVFSLTILSSIWPALAQDPHSSARAFYAGKTIKFIVSTGAGGGFDAYTRMIAPLLEKELNATVVVQNMPGGGGLVSANHIYAAAGDPLQLIILNGNSAALGQLVDDPSVRFDLPKFSILGLVTTSPWLWIASPKSKMQTVDDFLKPGAKPVWAGSGQMGGISDGAAVTCEALKMACNIVRGYTGSAQGALALARGEADAMYVSDTSARNYVDTGGAKPVITVSDTRSRFFPDVPTVFEVLKLTDEQKWWFEFRAALDDLQRILAMPPNVPAPQLALMRDTLKKILTDPAVIAEGEKTQRYIAFKDAATVEKMIGTVLGSITPEQKAKAREVILRQ